MSTWYGHHPKLTKQEARELLPPAACKECVYWFSVVIGSYSEHWYHKHPNCERCGIPKWKLLDELTIRFSGETRFTGY